MSSTMKTLSLTQPWATLVVLGKKRFETRSWATKYRGPLLIHASKKFTRADWLECYKEPFATALKDAAVWKGAVQPYDFLPTGAIVGSVELCAVFHTEDPGLNISISGREGAFGNFGAGRFAWQLSDPVKFAEPISAKGSLGIWEFPESALGHLAERR